MYLKIRMSNHSPIKCDTQASRTDAGILRYLRLSALVTMHTLLCEVSKAHKFRCYLHFQLWAVLCPSYTALLQLFLVSNTML